MVIGEWGGLENALPPASPLLGVVETEPAPPPSCRPAPIQSRNRPGLSSGDIWLDRLAGKLARAMAEGATVRPCPLGGLDLELKCGRRIWFAGRLMREIGAAGLLPNGVPEWGAK